jgi:ADP-ribose pyrophosphatase YjhB (NUDIX family)
MDTPLIDKLALIDLHDGKLLMTLSYGKDTYYIPGGKRETGETDLAALSREIKEELQVDLDPSSLKLYGVFEAQAHGKPVGTIVRMTCYTGSYDGTPKPGREIQKIAYYTYQERGIVGPVDQLIFDDLKNKGLLL